jgi:hypothetical protein
MGLVMGYDSMGIGMSKPDDRAALEADLVHVCNGTKGEFHDQGDNVRNKY